MGKLKTALTNLATLTGGIEKSGDKALGDLEQRQNNIVKHLERINGGYELLYMYLKQKANLSKVQVTAWHGDTLKMHTDPKVVGFIKDIEAVRAECLGAFKAWEDASNILTQTLNNDLGNAGKLVGEIDAMIAKKKKKWLQSTKFKAKITTYEKTLGELANKLHAIKVDVDNLKTTTQSAGPQKLARLQLTDGKTVDDVFKVASKGLVDEIDRIKKFNGKRLAVLLKNYGTELKQIRTWVGEADEMEREAEE